MPRDARTGDRRARPGRGRIPVDSFSDIAFLLLIYFFLATTLIRLQGFTAQMPAGEKSKTQQEKTPIVNIRNDRVFLNDQPVDLPALRGRLAEMGLDRKEGEEKIVLLEASGEVTYQTYHAAMAAITKAGGVIGLIEEGGGK